MGCFGVPAKWRAEGVKMKKKLIILFATLIFSAIAGSLAIFFVCKDKNSELNQVKQAVSQTNQYLSNKDMNFAVFGNVLQEKLSGSLVYNIEKDQYLVIYKNKQFIYKDKKLKTDTNTYLIYDNIEQALQNATIGETILTKGYSMVGDGGNSVFKVCEHFEDAKIISASNKEETKTLKLTAFNSAISLYQMGYSSGDIDKYVDKFTSTFEYENLFIPNGNYRVIDNFDINVSNKAYYGVDACIYTDDTYAPYGSNNGCLFYVFNNISNIKIAGFNVRVYTNKKLADPLIGFLTVRDADGVTVNNCSFYLPEEAGVYATSGMIDLFTGWKNIIVKNCRLENYASTYGGGGIGVRDIFKKECENALFENNYIYCNCKDEVIAIFSGLDTSLIEDTVGGGNIENVTFKNNTIIGAEYNKDSKPRVVGITVGYQVSPVKDIKFIDNNITMYSANFLLLYGKTTNLTVEGNTFNIDSSYQTGLYTLFYHNVYADEAFNILVKNNTFQMLENSTIKTISATDKEFSFEGNTVNSDYSASRLLDSNSAFKNNTFNFDIITGCVYRDIAKVQNNIINVNNLNVVYEFYDLDIKTDIVIESDVINATNIGANLMMFNGSNIRFNGHSVTFKNFKFSTNNVWGEYYYLAYGTTAVQDSGVINFINSDLSVYNDNKHNFIARDDQNKITVNFQS